MTGRSRLNMGAGCNGNLRLPRRRLDAAALAEAEAMNAIRSVSMSDRKLRAGARVLGELLNDEDPVIQRAVTRALADHGKHEALGCAQLMYGALLEVPSEPTRWDRIRIWWRGWLERNWWRDYLGND